MRRRLFFASCVFAVSSLSACGSEGRREVASTPTPPTNPNPGPTPPPTPVTKPSTANFDTDEYRRSNAVVASNAIQAYQAGASGAGVKVGIVDTGLNPNLAEFAGRIDPASRDVAGSRSLEDVYGHGTAVASIIAGARNDAATQGVAFNSTIIMMKADAPGSCPSSCYFVNIADAIDAARVAGARVINLSIGGEARSDITDAIRRAAQAGMVIVIGAGNDGAANPSGLAQAIAAAAPGQVIIVGALGSGDPNAISYDQLLSYSNRAGGSTGAYLSAPGYLINVVVPSGGVDQLSGTSFSAPVVSGAIALLAEAFPNLSARQLVQLLLDSADDLGSSGVDSAYGHGRVNVGRAFQPVGKTTMAGAETLVSPIANGILPTAAGDAASARNLPAIVLDAYKRAFQVNLAATLRTRPASQPLSHLLSSPPRSFADRAGPVEVGMEVTGRPFILEPRPLDFEGVAGQERVRVLSSRVKIHGDSRGAFAFGIGVSAELLSRELASEGSRPAFLINDTLNPLEPETQSKTALVGMQRVGSIHFNWSGETGAIGIDRAFRAAGSYKQIAVGLDRRSPRFDGSARLSLLQETTTVLGGQLSEVFGRRGTKSHFLLMKATFKPAQTYKASMTLVQGWTKFSAGKMTTSAFSFEFIKEKLFAGGDLLALRLSQPLRVKSGGFAMLLPSSYDYQSEASTFSLARLPLKPSSREISGELAYSSRIGAGDLSINAFARAHPGHVSQARPDVGATVRFAEQF